MLNDDLMLALGTHLAGEKVRLEVHRFGTNATTVDVTLVKNEMPGKPIASSLGSRPRVRGPSDSGKGPETTSSS